MADTEPREQHNHGSGTFVGGDVNGDVSIWQVFLPSMGKKRAGSNKSPHRRPEPDDELDDYGDLGGPLVAAGFLAVWTGWAAFHEIMGRPWTEGASPPGTAQRIIGGIAFAYACLACVATFLARTAQVFELWSEQCRVTAEQSRGRVVAWPPALMARGVSLVSAGAASLAEVLASLYGWRSFGGTITQRARIARMNAAANAKAARAAVREVPNCVHRD